MLIFCRLGCKQLLPISLFIFYYYYFFAIGYYLTTQHRAVHFVICKKTVVDKFEKILQYLL